MVSHVNIAKLNAHHSGCKYGFLSIQYSNKNLANCIFRPNRQIFDSPIIPPHVHYIANCVYIIIV